MNIIFLFETGQYNEYVVSTVDDNKKTPSEVFCSTRTPSEITKQKPCVRRTKGFCLGDFWGLRNHQAETLSPKDEGFLPWWFLRGFWLNRIPNECGFYFYPVISWIHIFISNYSCFHIAIDLRFFTSNSLCLNVHLKFLSVDNHLVSKQPQWQCHVTMTSQWGHVTKQILNLAGWGQLEKVKTNYLTIIWVWYDHDLSTYIFFMSVWCNSL